jgi:hypothetical protein
MYLKQIEQLVDLQHIDSEIISLQAELEAAPKEVEELEGRYNEMQAQRDQMQEKMDLLRSQEEKLTGEIEEDNLKIKKSKNKLMMVSNTKEYHAMMREMDNLEKLNRMREEEKVALGEELERQKEAATELDSQMSELNAELEGKRSNLNARVDKAQKRLNSLQKQRKNAGKHVPAPVLGRYEFIRSRLDPPVIVPVYNGVCSGCNISIPPQSFIELQKGQQILSCPNCQRLIYWVEHFNEEQLAAKAQEMAQAREAATQ